MKWTSFLFTVAILLFRCGEDEFPGTNIIEMESHAEWEVERFKDGYDIQFPGSYEGGLTPDFWGNSLVKTRNDGKIAFSYSFCDQFFCCDFGDEEEVIFANSLSYLNEFAVWIKLDERKEFQRNGEPLGVLFHNTADKATGKYFMNQNGVYREALTIRFEIETYQEVEDILKTIAEAPYEVVEATTNPNWEKEDFKSTYTIRFPDDYEGGMRGFEGNIFFKNRYDDLVVFSYYFCEPHFCYDFGERLNSFDSLYGTNYYTGASYLLTQKVKFLKEEEVTGVLFYELALDGDFGNPEIDAMGVYYMMEEGEFLEGLTVHFKSEAYGEVLNILQTIQPIDFED